MGNLHPVEMSRILHKQKISGIQHIEEKGRNRAIIYGTPIRANDFNNNEEQGYETFILASLLTCKGAVKGIGANLSEDKIINRAYEESDNIFKVVEACRINHRVVYNVSNSVTYVPTGLYIFTFHWKNFLRYVNPCSDKLEVRIYIRPMILCLKCYMFNHPIKQCNGKARCHKCGNENQSRKVWNLK